MRFSVLTLFPELIHSVMQTSITGKALQRELFELKTVQIRDFAVNQYGKVDDYLFGGGTGMLMMAEPVHCAWMDAADRFGRPDRTIYLTPKGKVFRQSHALELAALDHVALLCGHYEGIDQRVLDEIVDEELSLGDFVLTGGELAACVIMDATVRLLPGVLPGEQAYLNESHMQGLLEQPHYTRPSEWRGHKVPDVLLSGHQANIEIWQRAQSLLETLKKRPDLLREADISEQDWQNLLRSLENTTN